MGREYVGWEERVVCREKGRREVHYYLNDGRGAADLAVVGKEKSARHMAYVVPAEFATSLSGSSLSGLSVKLRSRRDVVDWLSAAVSDHSHSCSPLNEFFDRTPDVSYLKRLFPKNESHRPKVLYWLGSSWVCSKQWKHYTAFLYGEIKISVQDFVFVTVEENIKRVAYVEDMYEDLASRKKVMVRWLHQVDEVNAVLPLEVKDREIFFSLCVQDLCADRINGLAAVLSPQHYAKCLETSDAISWKPFLCRRQIDHGGVVKPFDITCVGGYWNQEILRCSIKSTESTSSSVLTSDEADDTDPLSRKRPRRTREDSPELKSRRVDSKPSPLVPKKDHAWLLIKGQHVEVLSQDSGLRGCWFRCLVLKLKGDKVKVRYTDLQNADGSGPLEEWIPGPRLVLADKLGLRLKGRPSIRPLLQAPSKLSSLGFNVGSVVDAWWHDGWWEGLVVSDEDPHALRVYFPGEEKTSEFEVSNLRHAHDWSENRWYRLRERPDIASNLLAEPSPPLVGKEGVVGPTLDNPLCQLRWTSSRKRCQRRQRCYGRRHNLLKHLAVADGSVTVGGVVSSTVVS